MAHVSCHSLNTIDLLKQALNTLTTCKEKEKIMDKTINQLLREAPGIVDLFEKYGIDVDAYGPRTLSDVIVEKNLPEYILQEELDFFLEKEKIEVPDDKSDITQILDYLVHHHHRFAKDKGPLIQSKLERLSQTYHGNPANIQSIKKFFTNHMIELYSHMRNEEFLLFPYIREMSKAVTSGKTERMTRHPLMGKPLMLMQNEHTKVEEDLRKLRDITNNFSIPADGNETYAKVMAELESWEEDMVKHNTLENGLLSSKTRELELKFSLKFHP